MDIKVLLASNCCDINDIAEAIGMKKIGNAIVSHEEYSEEYFLDTLKEYIESDVEFGKNPSYVLKSLLTNYEDKAIFLEMLRGE